MTSAGNIVVLPTCSLVAEPGCVEVNNLQAYSGMLGVAIKTALRCMLCAFDGRDG